MRVGQLPPEWHRLVPDQGRITPETVSFTRVEFGELQSSVSKILAILSDLDWWVAGVSNLAKDIQPHLSHDENLQLAGTYSQRYLLESCRSLEELEIQVTARFSHIKLRERDGYLSRLNPHVPLATRRELRVSPLVGEYLFDEVLVSQAGDRLQGDVSLKSNTIMLDTLARKSQAPKARTFPQPKRPAPASTPLVSFKKPKQNPRAEVGVNSKAKAKISPANLPTGEKAVEQKGAGVHEGTGGAPIDRTSFGPITRENSREAIKILGGLVRDRCRPLGHAHRTMAGLSGKYRGGISRYFPPCPIPPREIPGNTFYYNYSIIFHVNRKL